MPYGFNDNKTKYDLPTKLSQFNNDSGFITNAVNNLTNYYNKTYMDSVLNIQSKNITCNTNIVQDGVNPSRTPEIRLYKYGKIFQYSGSLRIKSDVSASNYYTIATGLNISDAPYTQADYSYVVPMLISGAYHNCLLSFVTGVGYSIQLHVPNAIKEQSPGCYFGFSFTTIGYA